MLALVSSIICHTLSVIILHRCLWIVLLSRGLIAETSYLDHMALVYTHELLSQYKLFSSVMYLHWEYTQIMELWAIFINYNLKKKEFIFSTFSTCIHNVL